MDNSALSPAKNLSTLGQRLHPNFLGIFWAFIAVGLFSFIYISGKLVDPSASTFQIVFLRYIGGLFTIIIVMVLSRHRRAIRTTQPHVHFIRAVAGGGSSAAAIFAASNMAVSDATAIGLLDGVFTVVFGVLFLKEHVSPKQLFASLTCLLGAMIVVFGRGVSFDGGVDIWLPASVALIGAALVAVESILIKTLARSELAMTVLLYVNLFGALIFSVPAWLYWGKLPLQSVATFLALGPIALVAQVCNIRAFRISDVAILGPIRYSWIVFGSAFGVILFNEHLSMLTYIGGLIVLMGGTWLAMANTRARINSLKPRSWNRNLNQ